MFSVNIAVRQHGTINLKSGIFDRVDTIGIITAMTNISEAEAIVIVSEAIRMGLHKRRGGNFEIIAKAV